MMPYREAPPAAGLPFPRKNIALFAAFAIAVSAAILVLPTLALVSQRGRAMLREGGFGMFALIALSLVIAGVCGVAGTLAVRGHRIGTAVVVAAPVVPAVIAALLCALASRGVFAAVGGIDPGLRARILAAGLGESDALPAYGCFLSAIACGAAAVSLLGGGASLDRKHHQAKAGAGWAVPAMLGGIAFIVALVLRVVLRVGFGTLLLALPSIAITTALACLAAINAPLVRDWRDPREADAWTSSLMAAAFLAAGGLVLLDLSASFFSEATALSASSAGALDLSQRAGILAAAAEEHHGYRVLAAVDGLFAFAIVAAAGLAGLGRSSRGRLRFPRGLALYIALGAAALLAVTTIGVRAWQLGRIGHLDAATASGASGASGTSDEDALQLPQVPQTRRVTQSSGSGTVLHVSSEGRSKLKAAPYARSSVLVVEADRRATWGDTSRAIREVVRSSQSDLGADRLSSIELRVTLTAKTDRSQLGPYVALLGPETWAMHIAIPTGTRALRGDDDEDDDDLRGLRAGRTPPVLRPRAHEIMDGIAAAIAKRPTVSPSAPPDIGLLPPDGAW